jgi:RNA polymerase sigma factor (sigma-70 family)
MPAPDKSTFEEIIREHGPFIRRTLAHLGVCARVLADVVQEVFRGIDRGLATFDPALARHRASPMRGWLFGICERQAASHHRSENRRNEILLANEDLDITKSSAPSAEDKLLEAERKALLFELLATLEPQRRAVIVAYELEGIAMQEVAKGMSIPVNTAWNRLRLARDDLRAAWRRRVAGRRRRGGSTRNEHAAPLPRRNGGRSS